MLKLNQKDKFSSFWLWWRGENLNFTLERKIFHSFSLIVMVALLFIIPVNYVSGLYHSFLLTIEIFVVQALTYYISRFKNNFNLAIDISAININLILGINYFFNSGIEGPTLLLYALSLFLLLSISRLSKLIYLVLLNLTCVAIITGLEYYNADFIIVNYNDTNSKYIDLLFSYLISLILIYAGTSYLKKSYIFQRKIVLEKAEALKVLNNEKDKIFSVISHDLRTPLANIQQYLELANTVELTDEERKVIRKDLLELTRNSLELLNNLLHWSKNQMDGNIVNKRFIFIAEELALTFNFLKSFAQKKDVAIEIFLEENIAIYADLDMLKLILRNLIHNAIKFSPAGGLIDVTMVTEHDHYLITVADKGIGIKKNEQAAIFTMSPKTNYGTNKEKGTGLGLMLCKEYTEMQGGKIWFTSTEHVGTTFYVSLPKNSA
ncbi:sensor histidine kinase [Pedobacter glucosidilyticus]|uniref:sensor histidine kinase n=1 Tax=Pedobacter glucosidilyticus TaxID=1122941 RepID=UPI00047B5D07|nr:HAMP domain-containing sensor histidine kinase [Pedobacter glucosidilyticus]